MTSDELVEVGQASIPVKRLPPRSMINLHHELGRGQTEDGVPVRFCQHINGGCFWLTVGDVTFQATAEDLMNAMSGVALADIDKEVGRGG